MVRTNWPDDEIHTCVCSAPAIAGTTMYEIELGCFGEHSRMIKNKAEFRDLLNIMQLGGPSSCSVCKSCSLGSEKQKISRGGYRAEDLNAFLESTLTQLRAMSCDTICACAQHFGVVKMLADFLSIRDERCLGSTTKLELCQFRANQQGSILTPCALSRSLSNQFVNFDSSQ